MKTLLVISCLAFAAFCVYAVGNIKDNTVDHVLLYEARMCAIESDGTDQAIVDCYTDRGLPAPSDV